MRCRAGAPGQLVQPTHCQAGSAEGLWAGPGHSCGALLHGSNHGQWRLQLRGVEEGPLPPHRPAEADGLLRRAYTYAAHRERQAVSAAVRAETGQQLCGDGALQTHQAERNRLCVSGSVHAVVSADLHPQVSQLTLLCCSNNVLTCSKLIQTENKQHQQLKALLDV